MVATRQALEDARLTIVSRNADNAERVGVVIGTAVGGIETLLTEFEKFQARGPRRLSPFFLPMMLPDTAPGHVAISCGAKGPNMAIVSACATGSNAIGEAAEMIRRGHADAIISGGSEGGPRFPSSLPASTSWGSYPPATMSRRRPAAPSTPPAMGWP